MSCSPATTTIDPTTAEPTCSECDLMGRLTDIETKAQTSAMNAERLEDFADGGDVAGTRRDAERLFAEGGQVAREHGLDPDEENF